MIDCRVAVNYVSYLIVTLSYISIYENNLNLSIISIRNCYIVILMTPIFTVTPIFVVSIIISQLNTEDIITLSWCPNNIKKQAKINPLIPVFKIISYGKYWSNWYTRKQNVYPLQEFKQILTDGVHLLKSKDASLTLLFVFFIMLPNPCYHEP